MEGHTLIMKSKALRHGIIQIDTQFSYLLGSRMICMVLKIWPKHGQLSTSEDIWEYTV